MAGSGITLVLLLVAVAGRTACGGDSSANALTDHLPEPLHGATSAVLDLNAGDGIPTIDRLTGVEQLLAGGALQYVEKQGAPARTMIASLDQATIAWPTKIALAILVGTRQAVARTTGAYEGDSTPPLPQM